MGEQPKIKTKNVHGMTLFLLPSSHDSRAIFHAPSSVEVRGGRTQLGGRRWAFRECRHAQSGAAR
jgi:hypothetical protein